ncbi:MAG: selenoneine biosynthesis selenosugar synthase SenB [Aquabacterium sp.]
MSRPRIALVTPALADANNGNWQTARRWAGMLAADYQVRLAPAWHAAEAPPGECALVALHARRSAPSIQAWRRHHPAGGLVVVLTGTDLYRDIATDADAQASLRLADRLVVLQPLGLRSLPAAHRGKAVVCVQSARARRPIEHKAARHLRALMVGHLRDEKDPATYFDAARRLAGRADIRLDHIGRGLDETLADQARALMVSQPRYRWLGGLPHGATRARIQRAHVLVHASRMEGGAHVVIEAVVSGTPVLASRIDGNVGLLGPGYGGYFEPGDAAGLAALLQQARDDPAMLPALRNQCRAAADCFRPEHERGVLLRLLHQLTPLTE